MNRVEIIEEISEIAKFRDAPLIAAAMDVVRNPDNETMMNTAQKLLLQSEERAMMFKQVTHIINRAFNKAVIVE